MLNIVGSFLVKKKKDSKKKYQGKTKQKTKNKKQVRGSSVSATYAFNELVPTHYWEAD